MGIRRYIRTEHDCRKLKEVQYPCFELARMIVKISVYIFIRTLIIFTWVDSSLFQVMLGIKGLNLCYNCYS